MREAAQASGDCDGEPCDGEPLPALARLIKIRKSSFARNQSAKSFSVFGAVSLMRQVFSAVLVFGLAIATLQSAFAATRTSEPPQTVRLKIMPLGDSITFGTPDPGYGGYRHLLSMLLANDGYAIDFVGSERNGKSGPANEGHPGWTISQIKDGIDSQGWLATDQPDVILLHIGTNDIRGGNGGAAPDNLSILLDDILTRLPRTRVIVAEIIPFRQG